MASRWTWPLLFTGLVATWGCSSTPSTPAPDAAPDAAPDVTVDATTDMTMPPPDMMQPPPDMTMPPPDMTMPPPDMMMPPPDMMMPPPDMMMPPPDMMMPPPDMMMPATARTTATNGSAVAISSDDRTLVAVNRTAHSVAVFGVTTAAGMAPTLSRTALLPTPDGEPWAAVISNDDTTAYVILRKARQVIRITGLRGTPAIDSARATVGSEPTGIAISPTGRKLWVANWAEGTVSEIDTATMMVARTIDLNASLASSGMLGTVSARPGLAHPRALVVTNNGNTDDADETVYVTEFFSQARTSGVPTDDSAFDVGRQGVVYRFNAGTGAVGGLITLGPTADTGFRDSVGSTSADTGGVTGCFPNQLYTAVLNNNRLYITGMCESPRGPTGPVIDAMTNAATNTNNFKTQIHPTLYVVDTMTYTEREAERVTMTRTWQQRYASPTAPATPVADNAARRFPLLPVDLAFAPTTSVAYIAAYGADAVFRLRFNPDGTVGEVGSVDQPFVNLSPGGTVPAGQLPVGLVVTNARNHAFVVNQASRNVTTVAIATQTAIGANASADAPTGMDAARNTGQRLFVTGLGRWSFRGQAWNSCESCHPDGLTDNVTWFFARGPRQTTSLDGSFDRNGRQRLFNWTAIFDETHDFELNTRGNSGGVGAIVHRPNDGATPPVVGNADRVHFDGTTPVPTGNMATATPQAGLSGSTTSLMPSGSTMPRSVLNDWNEIDEYVKAIRPPRALTSLNAADVMAGRNLFLTHNCAACHGGQGWTISRRFFVPGETNNNPMTGRLRATMYTAPMGFPAALNPPTAASGRTAALRLTPMDGANDQINCVLRDVGTFPAMLDAMQNGVAPAGVRIREVRANMMAAAQGLTGFNPPSLVGMNTGAPFFHAGNARTLEEAFATTFARHYNALSANFLAGSDRATEVRQLVAFLLSIDDDTTPAPMPSLGYNPDLCPTSL